MLSSNFMFSELLNSFSLEILFTFFILSNIVFAITLSSDSQLSYPSLLNVLCYFSIFFFISSLIFILPYNFVVDFNDFTIYNLMKTDFLSASIKGFLITFTILLYMFNVDFCKNRLFQFEYELLISLSVLGLLTLLISNDFLTMYIAIELLSLSFYVLAGSYKNSIYSAEAGLKYFVLGALSSCFLLFGINFIYMIYGTLNFNEIKLLVNDNDFLCLLGLLFLFSGFFFKVGVSPFHM